MSFLCRGWFALGAEFENTLRWKVGNGQAVSFWSDRWCNELPLSIVFPRLYRLAENKDLTVNQCWVTTSETGDWLLQLRRITQEEEVEDIAQLMAQLQSVVIDPGVDDEIIWNCQTSRAYTVKEGYKWWRRDTPEVPGMARRTSWLWKRKMPLKVKIFLWVALQDRLLTKSYRAKWRPESSATCELCDTDVETVDHLFCACQALIPFWGMLRTGSGAALRFNNKDELWEQMVSTKRPGDTRAQAEVRKILIPAALWAIWLCRNKKIFQNQRFYTENLWENTTHFIVDWGCGLAGAGAVQLSGQDFQIDPG
ncbi:hypothetical protein QJS10_CPA01g02200 [Acorus calamus]|uniref:Reverse transcriptase zinc-binding domain-containing protein n=1 Tax=Acorus calamus TaxID=4465 RepID=A0AAV9FJL7_ACOCL|nr:hypothetical protein QJS10_CPA01g02200 [Acorus calamus]